MYNNLQYSNLYAGNVLRPHAIIDMGVLSYDKIIRSISGTQSVGNDINPFIKNDINLKLSNFGGDFDNNNYFGQSFAVRTGYKDIANNSIIVAPMGNYLVERSDLDNEGNQLSIFGFGTTVDLNKNVNLPLTYNQKGFEVLRSVFLSLGISGQLLIKTKDLNDENGRKVGVIGFSGENLRDIIRNLLEFTGAKFWWSKDLNKWVYQTREYLAYKKTLPEEIYYSTDIHDPIPRTTNLLLDSSTRINMNFVKNSLEIYRYIYTKQINQPLGGKQIYLAAGASTIIQIDYGNNIYSLGNESVVFNSANSQENNQGDDYLLINPTAITGVLGVKDSNGISVTITNATVGNIFIDFSIYGDTLSTKEEKLIKKDNVSIEKYGERKKTIRNNPFFQQIASTDYFISDFMINNKDPKLITSLTILGNSLHMLTDIVKYDDIPKKITGQGLIEKIDWSYSESNFIMNLQLLDVSKVVYQKNIPAIDIIVENSTIQLSSLTLNGTFYSLSGFLGPSIIFDTEQTNAFSEFQTEVGIIVSSGIINLQKQIGIDLPNGALIFDTEQTNAFSEFQTEVGIIVSSGIINLQNA